MSSKDKLISRFLTLPSDFTFEELERLLTIFGYAISNKGKTSGSRVVFKDKEGHPIMLHKPHPVISLSNTLYDKFWKNYRVKDI